MAANSPEIFVFVIDEQRFAIPLQSVEQVIRAQTITKLSDAPGFIEGVIDYHGELIAVINLRSRLSYPLQEVKINNRFIIVNTSDRKLVLIADEVEGILLPDADDFKNSKDIDGGLKYLTILRDDNGIIFIYDLENVLSKSEEIELKKIMETRLSHNDGS